MSDSSSSGMGILGVLQVVFIVLKLCRVIDWAWVWVLSPAILGVVSSIIISGIIILIFGREK